MSSGERHNGSGEAPAEIGPKLFQLLKEYCDLGIHRTGTPVDRATIHWFVSELRERGATVERQRYSFDRYEGRCRVTLDGAEVPSEPLYYEAVGNISTDRPYKGKFAIGSNRVESRLGEFIEEAKRQGAPAAVIATTDNGGHLVLPNRDVKIHSGLPTALIPGALAERLETAAVTLEYEARLEPGWSENVIAAFGDIKAQNPLLITTPLTGWFRCAGERGPGVVLALEIAGEIAQICPVVVVSTTGHELGHLGLHHYLSESSLHPRAILHLGASLAAGVRDNNGQMVFSPFRLANTNIEGPLYSGLEKALDPLEVSLNPHPERWYGEAIDWQRHFHAPMLSFVGTSPLFHTPDDLPEEATSPLLLAKAYQGISKAARLLVG